MPVNATLNITARPVVDMLNVWGPKFMNCLRPRSNVSAPFCTVGLFWPARRRNWVVPEVASVRGAEGTVKVAKEPVEPV